jgi:hypothetical protein
MSEPTSARLTAPAAILAFITGGNAIFTLVSKLTGARKTFRVEAALDKKNCFFVSLLVGPQNDADYRYLGFLFPAKSLGALGFALKPNKTGWGLDACNAFAWLLEACRTSSPKLDAQAEVWHEGRCCRCGRTLTTPESIAAGIGPVCAEKSV